MKLFPPLVICIIFAAAVMVAEGRSRVNLQELLEKRKADPYRGYGKREAGSREGRQSKGKRVTIEVEIDLKKLEGICAKYFSDDSNTGDDDNGIGWVFKYLKREVRNREGRQSKAKTVKIEVEIELNKLSGICQKYFGGDSNGGGDDDDGIGWVFKYL